MLEQAAVYQESMWGWVLRFGFGVATERGGWKLLGFLQAPEEILTFGKVGILPKSDGQLTPNQFPHKSSQQKSRLAGPAPNPEHSCFQAQSRWYVCQLEKGLANFYYKGLDGNYFRLCGPCDLCCNYLNMFFVKIVIDDMYLNEYDCILIKPYL